MTDDQLQLIGLKKKKNYLGRLVTHEFKLCCTEWLWIKFEKEFGEADYLWFLYHNFPHKKKNVILKLLGMLEEDED